MRVKKWVSGLRSHPYLSIAADAVRATRDGLGAAVSDSGGDVEDPEAWGPTDGPAPVDDTTRSPIVEIMVSGDGELVGEVQFWTPRGGGAILGAWEIDGQSGQHAVFDRENGRLWLGRKPYWSDAGQRHTHVDLSDDAQMALWEAFGSLLSHHQRMNLGVMSGQTTDELPFDDSPAPTTVDTGEPVSTPVANNSSDMPARFQPWRPENAGAVYVAWQVGDRADEIGIFHGAGLWLGEDSCVVSPSGAPSPFVYINDREVEDALRDEIEELRERGAEGGLEGENVMETVKATHPDSPGRNSDLAVEADENEGGSDE